MNNNQVSSKKNLSGSESERLAREADFHDHAFEHDVRSVTTKYYEATRSSSNRYRELVLDCAEGATVLEYGCGTGSLAPDIARRNGRVTGIDISPRAIEMAFESAVVAGVQQRCQFSVMNAEALEFSDHSFDVICGSGILHHLDLEKAYSEIRRVLRPGGQAIFFEPLGHNVVINLYRSLTPKLRTPDEHPLLKKDIEVASQYFEKVDVEFFHVFEIATAWFPEKINRIYRPIAAALDKFVTHRNSPIRHQAWMSIMRMR